MAPPLSNVVVFGPETNTFTVNLLRAFHGAGVSAALLSVSRDLDDPRGSSPPTAKRIARIVRASTVPLIMVGNFLVAGLVKSRRGHRGSPAGRPRPSARSMASLGRWPRTRPSLAT